MPPRCCLAWGRDNRCGPPCCCPRLAPRRSPLNRILVAQRITQPQMAVSLLVAAQHVAVCHLLIHRLGLGFLGAAFASAWSNLLSVALLAAWVALAGKGQAVWGRPSREALAGWRQFGRLAYASAGEPAGCVRGCSPARRRAGAEGCVTSSGLAGESCLRVAPPTTSMQPPLHAASALAAPHSLLPRVWPYPPPPHTHTLAPAWRRLQR